MKIHIALAAGFAATLLQASNAHAFCGFYVAKADSKLFNKASQVALVRDGDKTVMTMSNDFQGDLKEFAMVIPVPVALVKEQIHIGERSLLERLDAYSSPRLVEYTDADPCAPQYAYPAMSAMDGALRSEAAPAAQRELAKSMGVTIEARYTVGEYDILILSAKQSGGLKAWLSHEGYRVPNGAGPVLESYIKQQMHFFVAKVNLAEQARTGYTYLRPIQIAYQSPKFMLPIRLGTVNANGEQELFVYALTKNGRVETTNYRTVNLPTGENVPEYVKDDFGPFYKAMFKQQVQKQETSAVFTEYAWDLSGFCDPCSAEPPTNEELRKLGVFWLNKGPEGPRQYYGGMYEGSGTPVFLTRLHVRYDAEHFPEDLVFQETADKQDFQGRYVLQHPYPGYEKESCSALPAYQQQVHARQEGEAKTLASLTGWSTADIRKKMKLDDAAPVQDRSWFKSLWK